MGSYTIMAMSGLRTIRFPTRRNFIAFLATPSFVFNPVTLRKREIRTYHKPASKFRHGNESFEDPDDFPRNSSLAL